MAGRKSTGGWRGAAGTALRSSHQKSSAAVTSGRNQNAFSRGSGTRCGAAAGTRTGAARRGARAGAAVTYVPEQCRVATKPSLAKRSYTSAAVLRETPKMEWDCRVTGSLKPSARRPSRMAALSWAYRLRAESREPLAAKSSLISNSASKRLTPRKVAQLFFPKVALKAWARPPNNAPQGRCPITARGCQMLEGFHDWVECVLTCAALSLFSSHLATTAAPHLSAAITTAIQDGAPAERYRARCQPQTGGNPGLRGRQGR